MSAACTIQDVFNRFYPEYTKTHELSAAQRKVAYHIRNCKTGAYGDKLINSLDHIILVDVPKDVRNQRVRTRLFQKFGKKMRPGGNLYDKEQKWFDIVDSRPDDYVLTWMVTIKCPVIMVDGTLPTEQNIKFIMSVLS